MGCEPFSLGSASVTNPAQLRRAPLPRLIDVVQHPAQGFTPATYVIDVLPGPGQHPVVQRGSSTGGMAIDSLRISSAASRFLVWK